jgi:carboxypeptidase C (cathepsin A)
MRSCLSIVVFVVATAVVLSLLAGHVNGQSSTTQSTDPTARTTTRPAAATTTTQAGEKGDRLVVTEHGLKVGERVLRYTATTGTMAQKDEAGATKADMFFVAYTLKRGSGGGRAERGGDADSGDARTRPIMFVFNGGPGAASVWLHLGTAGPKRIDIGETGVPAAPPFRLVDNESTWLDASDLVFIDPVGTGYSRPAQGEKGEQFYGVEEDIRSVGSFIRLYTTRFGRWPSPKFLAGESYGTTRAAGLSDYLLEKQGISLNGIILISAVLNFQTLATGGGNDLPYPLYLPTYAAVAAYHKKLAPELQADLAKTVREVERFALTDYAAALAAGDSLDEAGKRAIAEKVARYTGLESDWILRGNLRINPTRFRQELLARDRKVIGRFDARITGFTSDPQNDSSDYDPSLSLFLPLYSGAFNDYVRTDLEFESDLSYEVLTERVQPWNFGGNRNGYLYVADTLRGTMLKNPQLKLLVGSGKLDLATPYLASDYTVNHLNLPPELRRNITQTYYPAGHMMYHDAGSRRQLHDDITNFMRAAAAGATTRSSPTTTRMP